MKIEILYPEIANLFGDSSNMAYLRQCLPEAEFVETHLQEQPVFVSERVDLIYMGAMSESGQHRVIRHLQPYKELLWQRIEENVPVLMTGNAMEVLFQSIQLKGEPPVEGLGLLEFIATGNLKQRYNGLVRGRFEGFDLVGFKTQFTRAHGDNGHCAFFQVDRGMGMHEKNTREGVHMYQFYGTYLVGPLLLLNPLFTEYLLGVMGVSEPKLPYRQQLINAYEKRLAEFCDPNVAFE